MNLHRVPKKGETFPPQEYDKVRTVQHKNRISTLPKIASPAKMNTIESEFSEDTSTIEKEEVVNDRKDDKNKNTMRIKSQNSQITLPLLKWRKV